MGGTEGTGCISGGGDPGPEDLRERGRMCVSGVAGALPSASGRRRKRCSRLAGHGVKQQSSKGARQLAGPALPPGHRPHRSQGTHSRGKWPKA